jgi:hypothetical protein
LLKYPFSYAQKAIQDDISEALEPLMTFLLIYVEAESKVAHNPQRLDSENYLMSHRVHGEIYKFPSFTLRKISAPRVFHNFLSSWHIERVEVDHMQTAKYSNIPDEVLLEEINVVASALRYRHRKWVKSYGSHTEANILWPEDFTEYGQRTLRQYVGNKLKDIGTPLDTQEKWAAAIWEIRYAPELD